MNKFDSVGNSDLSIKETRTIYKCMSYLLCFQGDDGKTVETETECDDKSKFLLDYLSWCLKPMQINNLFLYFLPFQNAEQSPSEIEKGSKWSSAILS